MYYLLYAPYTKKYWIYSKTLCTDGDNSIKNVFRRLKNNINTWDKETIAREFTSNSLYRVKDNKVISTDGEKDVWNSIILATFDTEPTYQLVKNLYPELFI